MGQHFNMAELPSPDYLAYNLFVLIIWRVVDMNCHCMSYPGTGIMLFKSYNTKCVRQASWGFFETDE